MKNKILIFILVFCLCFLCFVIPSFASDNGISSRSVSNLSGTSWSVSSTWSASSGFGQFDVSGSVSYNRGDDTYFTTDFVSLYIGYVKSSSAGAYVGQVNRIQFITSSGGNYSIQPGQNFNISFSGGSDLNNNVLISWFETYGTNTTLPETGLIESGWDYMTSPPSLNLPPILERPDPSFIPLGGSYVFEGVGSYFLDNGLPYVFTHFAWELTSYTNSDNYTLEFQVQRESGVWITLYTFVVQSGTQTIVFYPDIYYFTLNSDVEVDIDSYNLFYSHFAPQLEGGIDDPDDFTDNPWLYIIEMVIEALRYPMWGYFSPWDIVTTISGIFIVTWLLKLIAGG